MGLRRGRDSAPLIEWSHSDEAFEAGKSAHMDVCAPRQVSLTRSPEMAPLMVGVVVLIVVSWLVNRPTGVPVPLWSAR